MNFLLERLSEPEIEPVTLVEAKRHIRQYASVTTEDDDISMLIKVAREWVEDYTGRVMVDQTWRLSVWQRGAFPFLSTDSVAAPSCLGVMPWWQDNRILLRRSPVLELLSVKTFDGAGVETALDPASYVLWDASSKWPSVSPVSGSWIGTNLRFEFRAGFADRVGSPVTGAEVVPAVLKQAMKLVLANYDENREPVNIGNIVQELPLGLKWLLASQMCNMGMS